MNCCILPGFVQILENLESPEILFWHFLGLESPGKMPLVIGQLAVIGHL